jgi:hypothetical protein
MSERPILSLSDKRITKYAKTHGMLAVKGEQQRVFRIGQLPDGWKFVRSVRIDIKGLTISEAIAKLNKKLAGKLVSVEVAA